jgi:hypothetical protein
MNRILKFVSVTACLALTGIAWVRAQPDTRNPQPDAEHAKWVETCLKDFQSIKVGMTRGEIEKKLSEDGGLQSASPVRFIHPACASFKIDVEFDIKRDPADQGRAVSGKEDKATKISKPYIERPFED